MCTGYGNLIWFRLSSPRDLKRVSEHFYCISVQIRGIHNFSYILIMFAIRLGYLWYILQNGQKQEFIILWSLASVARNSTHEFFFSRFRCHLYARAVSNDCKKPVCFSSSISKVIWWNKRECLTVRRRIFLYVNGLFTYWVWNVENTYRVENVNLVFTCVCAPVLENLHLHGGWPTAEAELYRNFLFLKDSKPFVNF